MLEFVIALGAAMASCGVVLWLLCRHQHSWQMDMSRPPLIERCECGEERLSAIQPPSLWIGFQSTRDYECPQCGDVKPRTFKLCHHCGADRPEWAYLKAFSKNARLE